MSKDSSFDRLTVKQLLEKGYAVTVFAPDELSGTKPEDVEERMTKAGWDTIQARKEATVTVKQLVKSLCSRVLDGEDPETLSGEAAFLQAVIDEDWGSMDSYSPVYGDGKYLVAVTNKF